MDFGPAGVSTLQSGLQSSAFFEALPNSFANSTDATTWTLQEQQEQQQQQQQSQPPLQQQLQLKTESGVLNPSQSVFVAPPALTSAREAPSVISDGHSSTSAHSSRAWQDSPASNPRSSPATSVVSPHSSSVSPLVDLLILSPSQETKSLPPETTEPPKRRRGRPRLLESKKPATRAAAVAAGGETSTTGTRAQQKKAAARRASNASTSGPDEFRENGPDDKKSRIRARNREAAYKCRQKKQKGIEDLQNQEALAENTHRNLTAEASMLRGEILMLKNMVLQHGGCGCSYIEEYIFGAAANLVQTGMAAAASAPETGQGGFDMTGQSGTGGIEGDSYVDWKMFDMDHKPGMPALGSESGFSALDDVSAHSVRAQSQGATMV